MRLLAFKNQSNQSNMKKILLSFVVIASGQMLFAQCTADYDFGKLAFGVSPDPVLGETFEVGYVGVPYEDILHLIVPVNASDVDPNPLLAAFTIVQVDVVSVELSQGGFVFSLGQLGLSYACNNGGTLPEPCSFLGGQQGCAAINGTPITAGVYNMTVTVSGIVSGPIALPPQEIVFDSYVLTINQDQSVSTTDNLDFSLFQNSPNPFTEATNVQFVLPNAGKAEVKVMNLMGETVYSETVTASRGANKVNFAAGELPAGVYIYSVEFGGQKLTKRMIVNK